MKTELVKIDIYPCGKIIQKAGQIIKTGGLVAFPTETVYGLGANALDEAAAAKIYKAKGRPSDNPLIVHIADRSELEPLVSYISKEAQLLMDAYWPGPMTLVFPKKDIVPYTTTAGLETVAVRFPREPAAQALIKAAGVPIAAPSANLSGRPSPTRAEHVIEDMNGRIDMIIDGGMVGIGIESSVIDVTGSTPIVLRPGYISQEMVDRVTGCSKIDASLMQEVKDDTRPRSPGMKYRHYAPKAEMILVKGEINKAQEFIINEAKLKAGEGKQIGIICTDESKALYPVGVCKSVGARSSKDSIAHNLFAVLREFDKTSVDIIYSESFSEDGLGQAIMNRMIKASGHHIVEV